MKKILHVVVAIAVFGCFYMVQAQHGFIIHATKGGCDRELHYRSITDGDKVGEPKLVTPKGSGADIWPVISYDGEWIAWCRGDMGKKWNHKYGQCDYHDFGNWDVFIARIDCGKTIPAKDIIKVANGYFPNWGDDAKTLNAPKTLYFTKYSDQTIQKTIISPDGSFTPPVEHSRCPVKKSGTDAHTQGSPDGKFILYRPKNIVLYSVEAKKDISGNLGGCHPTWGPRSKYFIRSTGTKGISAYFNTGTSVKPLGKSGVGMYFQGISNDAYWDDGRLWVIGKMGRYRPYTQNGEGDIKYTEVAIDGNGGWVLGKVTEVGPGCSPDIHFFPKDFNPDDPANNPNDPTNTIFRNTNTAEGSIAFTAEIKNAAAGLQLAIYLMDKSAKTAELFDIQGKRVSLLKMNSSLKHTMPLNGISNGRYILKVSKNNAATLKSIFISR